MIRLSKDFSAEFMTQRAMWHLKGTTVHAIDDVETFWRNEKNLQSTNEVTFQYQLFGLKKIGTENIDLHLSLKFWIQPYWYGLSISNHNEEQPFIKKMYHQQLTKNEMQTIQDILVTKVLDRIEWAIEHYEAKSKMK
jgi:hypothetical protein